MMTQTRLETAALYRQPPAGGAGHRHAALRRVGHAGARADAAGHRHPAARRRARWSAGADSISPIWSRQGEFAIDPTRGAQLSLEAGILARAGQAAGSRVHTARSRNDQVMVTELLYLRDRVLALHERTLA